MFELSSLETKFPLLCSCPGGVMTVTLTPALLAAMGFTSGGIVAGSLAAKIMSYCAIANGGGVAAGGLVAFLQSIGKLNVFIYFFISVNVCLQQERGSERPHRTSLYR